MKRLLVFLLLALVMGCAGSYQETETPQSTDSVVVRSAYEAGIVLHQQMNVDQSILDHYDILEVGRSGWDELEPQNLNKAVLYIDIWASSSYHVNPSDLANGYWQPGPGDIGQDEYKMYFKPGRAIYCYKWSDNHPARFATWVENAMAHGALGIFADDWGADRFWWIGRNGEEDRERDIATAYQIWPGYPSNHLLYEWVKTAEWNATLAILGYREDGVLVCNGPASQQQNTIHFHEHAGSVRWEGWDVLLDDASNPRSINDGRRHWLQLTELAPDGSLPPEGLANLKKAVQEAKKRPGKIIIGLSYKSQPLQGGSIYQIPINTKWADPRNWPEYYDTLEVKSAGSPTMEMSGVRGGVPLRNGPREGMSLRELIQCYEDPEGEAHP